MISDADLRNLERQLPHLEPAHKARVLELLEERDRQHRLGRARTNFLDFVKRVWPEVILGAHHTLMAEAFERLISGKSNRLILNIAPRHTKSEMTSWLLPAWYLGLRPKAKIMQCMNTQDLAAGFGRRVRNLISKEAIATAEKGHDPYHEIFPELDLAKDSGAASHWHTTAGGEYYGVGVGGKIAGRGADLLIIDDPHALEVTTEIPTPRGFVQIRHLNVGDEVFGPDGKPTRIIAKSEVWHDRPLYDVTTNDEVTIQADGGHLWNYRSGTNLRLPFINGTTRDLAAWDKPNRPVIPSTKPVEYPEQKLPIDPYLLGVWLGNGTATLGRITSHLDDVEWFRGQFDAAGYETTDQVDPHNFGVIGFRRQVIDVGLFDNKHIPKAYLLGSVEQRLALLQGLMDTDGHVNEAGGCSFDNTNRALVEGVQEILHSFGVRAILKAFSSTQDRAEDDRFSMSWRVNFTMPGCVRLPRKAARLHETVGKRGRSITVKDSGRTGSVQCITVERADGLFLAGRGYVVTHNSEQEAKQAESNPQVFDDVYDWYVYGPRQRLQPGASICVIQTRWSKKDLTGRLIKKMSQDSSAVADKWEVIEFPAIIDENTPHERSLWPGYWPLPTLQATRAALPVQAWSAQYQQNPTSEGAAIIKREYWRKWGVDRDEDIRAGRSTCPSPNHIKAWTNLDPPACKYTIASWDCASTKNTRSHPSAYTFWGIFDAEDPISGKVINNIILLSSYKERLEFPALKKKAKQFYDEDNPDTLLIESKSAGIQLIQEFRAAGLPVEDFSGSSRGTAAASNDKVARANSVSDIFASFYVWAPERRFAEEVIEQCASFPNGDEDDLVDSTVQALIRFRQGGFIRTANDEEDEEPVHRRRKRYY